MFEEWLNIQSHFRVFPEDRISGEKFIEVWDSGRLLEELIFYGNS